MLTKLRRARLAAGYTQTQMGAMLGLTLAGYRQKEVEERGITIRQANQIARILGTTLDELFLDEKNHSSPKEEVHCISPHIHTESGVQ